MAEKIYGWQGKILRVNLTTGIISEEGLTEELRAGYIGGAGINARLLWESLKDTMHADALSPENVLIFGFGVLTGTTFPCCSRFTVTAKSPVTGIFGDSNAGGFFPARVKQAGFDHIVITGKAPRPSALLIEKGNKPQIVDAADLWGLDSYETDEKIQARFGKCESARIGPAGENLVRYEPVALCQYLFRHDPYQLQRQDRHGLRHGSEKPQGRDRQGHGQRAGGR